MHPLFKKLAGQTALYGVSTIVGRLLNYLLFPVYVRIFLPQEYGVVTEFYSYVSFLFVVFTYGMETAYFRFSSTENDGKKVFDTATISLLISSIALVGIIFCFSQSIANWLRYPNHVEYIQWFALVLGFDALTAVPFAKLRQENRPLKFAFFKLIGIGLTVFLNLFILVALPGSYTKNYLHFLQPLADLIYQKENGISYVFIINLIASITTFLLFLPQWFRFSFHFNKDLWKRMMRYALPLIIVGLAGMVNETMDRILLKFNLPGSTDYVQAQVGIYGACYKLSLLLSLFVQAFRMAGEPFFFGESKKTNARNTYSMVMNYFTIVCCFIFLMIMLYINFFKHLLSPPYYSGLAIVPILLIANLCLGVYYNLTIWYKLTGKTIMGAYISAGGAIVTLLLNYYTIPRIGFMGSAWTTLICYASMMIASYILGQKYFPVPYQLTKFLVYLFSSLGLYAVSYFFIGEQFSDFLQFVLNSIMMLVFLVLVYLIEIKKLLPPLSPNQAETTATL